MIDQVGDSMAEPAFWAIVDEAKRSAADRDTRCEALRRCLESRSAGEIMAFDATYHQMVSRAFRWDLWGAAYVIGGGCSDDGFRYFCDFLISEGREVYDRALANPDSLAELEDASEVDMESYGYSAAQAYEAVTGTRLPLNKVRMPSEPAGKEWDEESLGRLFPRLAAKYDWGS